MALHSLVQEGASTWRKTARHGAIAMEFALSAPVLLLFLYGIIEFGRYAWSQHTVQYAVEEAIRVVVADEDATNTEIVNAAKAKATGMDVDSIAFTVTTETDAATGVKFITLQANYDFRPLLPLIPGDTLSITSKSRFPLSE